MQIIDSLYIPIIDGIDLKRTYNFTKTIPLFPKKCCLSKKLLWLKPCYKSYYYPVDYIEYEAILWFDPKALITYKLKNE